MSTRKYTPEQIRSAFALANAQQLSNRPALPKYYEEADVDWRKKGRLPKPDFIPNGKRLVILQEPAETMSKGGLVIPEVAANKYRPTVGVVIAHGDGYDANDPEWNEWERGHAEQQPTWQPPYKVGDRVVWGRFHGDTVVKTTVDEAWWDEDEDRGDGGVPVIIIHVLDVLGRATGVDPSSLPSLPQEDDGSTKTIRDDLEEMGYQD